MSKTEEEINGPEFDGLDKPSENWTRFPNCILDNLHMMKPNSLKVLAFMIRKTLGWRDKANKKFAAEYVAARLGMSEKTARTAIDDLEAIGLIVNIGREYKGVKLYEVKWRSPVKITDQLSPVKITGSARQKLPTVLETISNRNQDSLTLAPNTFEQSKPKAKSKSKTLDLSEIQCVVDILKEKDPRAEKGISLNLRNMIRNAIEMDGAEFVCDAVRGRMKQAEEYGKPLWLSTFFDPDRADWRAECAKIGAKRIQLLPKTDMTEIDALAAEMGYTRQA